jgi:peptide/nickel transport system substrate-binding protein
LKQDWAKVGVAVVSRPVNFNELVTQLEDGHRWDAILLGWGSGVPPDPLNGKNIILSSGRLHCWHPQQASPDQPWEAEVDAIVATMSGLFEEKERIPLWHKVLEIHAQQQPQMYLYAQNGYAVWKSRVKNVRCSILRPMATYNAEELWVEDGK